MADPTPFDSGQLKQVIDQITNGVSQFVEVADEFGAAARRWQSYISGLDQWLAGVNDLVNELTHQLRLSIDAAPVALQAYQLRLNWQRVVDLVSNVPGKLNAVELHVNQDWRPGAALTDYLAVVKMHADAAQRVGGVTAATVADRLQRVAGFGLQYYVGLSAVVLKLVSIQVAALKTLLSLASLASLASEALNTMEKFLDAVKEAFTNYMTLYSSLLMWCRPALEIDMADHTALPDDNWPKPYLDQVAPGPRR